MATGANSPTPLNAAVQRRMRSQKRRDTKLEVQLRRRLHALGYRFRVDYRLEPTLRCRGDIVFTRFKLVVLVDGCFWHGCPIHATEPRNNAEWWREKIAANIARDSRNRSALRELGWRVIAIWEHEPLEEAVEQIVRELGQARARNSE